MPKKSCRSRGQIAIFIALIFQVLFVFFAMTINVGMMVHDKINLQNSVDLAAYYGAQRQAELLNVIAHTNFQIRQSWKLLAWRLRVMADSARTGHPSQQRPPPNFNNGDAIWAGANDFGVCVTNKSTWNHDQVSERENICASGGNINVPEIPSLPVTFFPWDMIAQRMLSQLRKDQFTTCENLGQYNWRFALKTFEYYKKSIGVRHRFIREMASYMADFKDITGESIEEGMLATLNANLTRANLESLGENFQAFNSMDGIEKEEWLPQVKIMPFIPYVDIYAIQGCQSQINHITTAPRFGSGFTEQIKAIAYEPPPGVDPNFMDIHSSKGVEKNPWFMTYVGAKAATRPRKPFFPFGQPVTLVARSFAKPFGGTVGPWTRANWQRERGWAQSGELVDPMIPPAFAGSQIATSFTHNDNIPNYSRYPKDEMGLKSAPTLATLASVVTGRLDVDAYNHIREDVVANALAFDPRNPDPTTNVQRRFEVAAVAPDLFDIAYYSIQPTFYESYLSRMESIFNEQLRAPLDYGSQPGFNYNVLRQIEDTNALTVFNQAYFKVSEWEHLLTGWAPNHTMDFSFPTSKFGKCDMPPGRVATDSNCVAGGRAGFSVKIVSRNYLNSSQHVLGGNPNDTGPIFNPPGEF